ncbi:MAG TPA: hypothetical protein VGK02_03080 [Candidatus Aquicultor sp.]
MKDAREAILSMIDRQYELNRDKNLLYKDSSIVSKNHFIHHHLRQDVASLMCTHKN